MSDPNPPPPPIQPPPGPPPPRIATQTTPKRGCWFYGCITLAVLVLIGSIGTWLAVRHFVRQAAGLINYYTSTNAVPIERVTISDADLKSLQARVQSFANALDGKNGSRELVLSAADINALIQNDPQYKDVRDKLFVMLDGDQIKGRISVPLDQIHSQFKGRYLNGTATLKVSLQNGALDVRLQDVDVSGKPLPGPVMSGFKNVNLAQDAQKDQKARANLEKFESIEVKDSKLIIRAKEPVK